ncbi:MAG: hypothetical protein WCA84_10550 [Ignavibacteriaceae bacterium]
MKNIFFILIMLLGTNMFAQRVVIFDTTDVCYLNSVNTICKQTDQKKNKFLESFTKDNTKLIPYDSEAYFDTPPIAWGKKVNDFKLGRIAYYTSFPGGFVADLWLNNLLPNHEYKLTLNGKVGLVGNELLSEPVPGNENEKYYDFLIVKTDSKGEYHAKLGVYLKPGAYHVRFYVKDADDSLIILYHDYFKFSVE